MAPLATPREALVALPASFPPRHLPTRLRTRIRVLRYDYVSFLIAPRYGAYAVMVTDPEAKTVGGVSVGDPLSEARKRYPDSECGVQNRDTEYREYRFCTARVAAGRYIWLGGDPIRSISITIRPLVGDDPFR